MNSEFNDRVIELINEERVASGIDPLTVDSQLNQVAMEHSASMATEDFFDTASADGSPFSARILNAGYNYTLIAEAVGAGYSTPEAAVDGWLGSSTTRDNFLNPELTEIGVGYEFLENDLGTVNFNHYWTVDLGNPL